MQNQNFPCLIELLTQYEYKFSIALNDEQTEELKRVIEKVKEIYKDSK